MRTLFRAALVVAALGLALAGTGRALGQEYVYYSPSWSYRYPVYTRVPVIDSGRVVVTAPRWRYRAPVVRYRSAGYSVYPSTSPRRYTRAWRGGYYTPSYSAPTVTYRGYEQPQRTGLRRYHEWPYNPKAPGGPNH
jgi:hypothetical protein